MGHSIVIYYLLLLLAISCSFAKIKEDKPETLRGVYKLASLQEQTDTVFAPMEGVEILKIFTDSQWISPAYLNRNKKVVNLAGGTYSYSEGKLTEVVLYHSKDTVMGEKTTYRIELKNDTLYQSGIFKQGTADEWKVEEYWIRME